MELNIMKDMPTKYVVAAVIYDGKGNIFATQRGHGEWKDWWEFPGGKIEPGETPEEALIREIREELDIGIAISLKLVTVEYDYPDYHLVMHCYWCRISSGHPTLLVHEDAKWLPIRDLHSVRWLPADTDVLKEIEKIAPATGRS